MSDLSTVIRNAVANCLFRGTPLPANAKNCVALFTADPTPGALAGVEVTAVQWPGYVRQDVGVLSEFWSEPNDGYIKNLKRVNFAANAGDQTVIVTHMAFFDAVNGGIQGAQRALKAPKRIEPGDELSFAPGQLEVLIQ